jgi:hypothetical protein
MKKKDTDIDGKPESGERSQVMPFQKGNVNFDFLKPEDRETAVGEPAPGREPEDPESKRGMFFEHRAPRPLKAGQVLRWIILVVSSSLALIWSVAYGTSFVWLLLFPVLVLSLLWSVTMLALLLARPR